MDAIFEELHGVVFQLCVYCGEKSYSKDWPVFAASCDVPVAICRECNFFFPYIGRLMEGQPGYNEQYAKAQEQGDKEEMQLLKMIMNAVCERDKVRRLAMCRKLASLSFSKEQLKNEIQFGACFFARAESESHKMSGTALCESYSLKGSVFRARRISIKIDVCIKCPYYYPYLDKNCRTRLNQFGHPGSCHFGRVLSTANIKRLPRCEWKRYGGSGKMPNI